MRDYKHILLWENLSRIKKLIVFKKLVQNYFESAKYDWVVDGRIEDENAKQLRTKINEKIEITATIVESSGVNTIMNWSPPPAIGGYTQNIHLIKNIFNLGDFRISYDSVIDNLDKAIGVYKSDIFYSTIRVINPLFYFNLIFIWLSKLPFILIGRIGYNSEKAESSQIGRLIKSIIYILSATASTVTIIKSLGGIENIINWLKQTINNVIDYVQSL